MFSEPDKVSVADSYSDDTDCPDDGLYGIPDEKTLSVMRSRQTKKRAAMKLCTDLCVHVLLLVVVLTLSMQYHCPHSYKLLRSLERTFIQPSFNTSAVSLEEVSDTFQDFNDISC